MLEILNLTTDKDDNSKVEPEPSSEPPSKSEEDGISTSTFGKRVLYVGGALNWAKNLHLYDEISEIIGVGYNVINLAFYSGISENENPASASVAAWFEMSEAEQNYLLDYASDVGVSILVSVGGESEGPALLDYISQGRGVEYGNNTCQFAKNYNFHGVNLDLELPSDTPSEYFFDEDLYFQFLVDVSSTCRQILGPDKIISHAPLAPYFNQINYNAVYTKFMLSNPELVDYAIIQYYNADPGYYESYNGLFVYGTSVTLDRGTTIKELIELGIDSNKLVLGKPWATQFGGNYLSEKTLFEYGCRAISEFNWSTGFSLWQYDYNEFSDYYDDSTFYLAQKC